MTMAAVFDVVFAVFLPAVAGVFAAKNRYDKATFWLLAATNCEIGYWGAKIVILLEAKP
jgi:hypothetical protein